MEEALANGLLFIEASCKWGEGNGGLALYVPSAALQRLHTLVVLGGLQVMWRL